MAFGFKDRDVAERLKVIAGEKPPIVPPKQGPAIFDQVLGGRIFKTDGSGLTARVGTTVGKGNAVPYHISDSYVLTESKKPDGTSYLLEIINMSEGTVAGDTFIQAKPIDTRLVVDFEDCV